MIALRVTPFIALAASSLTSDVSAVKLGMQRGEAGYPSANGDDDPNFGALLDNLNNIMDEDDADGVPEVPVAATPVLPIASVPPTHGDLVATLRSGKSWDSRASGGSDSSEQSFGNRSGSGSPLTVWSPRPSGEYSLNHGAFDALGRRPPSRAASEQSIGSTGSSAGKTPSSEHGSVHSYGGSGAGSLYSH